VSHTLLKDIILPVEAIHPGDAVNLDGVGYAVVLGVERDTEGFVSTSLHPDGTVRRRAFARNETVTARAQWRADKCRADQLEADDVIFWTSREEIYPIVRAAVPTRDGLIELRLEHGHDEIVSVEEADRLYLRISRDSDDGPYGTPEELSWDSW
jgi:hypothetical protein